MNIKGIIYTDHILEASERDSLSKALSKLPSSHSAAFIFSKDKKKVGLVNPYHCIIKSSLPGNAKVDACIFHPPRLYINSPVEKVIEAFISSKIHYLPIFNRNEGFAGIVSARRVLDMYKNSPYFNLPIIDILKSRAKPVVTVKELDTVSTAIHLFKRHKISKLIVVNKDKKLKGVLSYYDIVHFLTLPKHKLTEGDKEGKKESVYNQKVSKFSKNFVLALRPEDLVTHALKMVLDEKIGSVVVVDAQRHPVGIVTTRDFFSLILQPAMGLQLYLLTKNLSNSSNEAVQAFLARFRAFLNKQKDLSKARLVVKEEKKGGVFTVLLSMLPKQGKLKVIKKEGKNLKILLQELKDKARTMHSRMQGHHKH